MSGRTLAAFLVAILVAVGSSVVLIGSHVKRKRDYEQRYERTREKGNIPYLRWLTRDARLRGQLIAFKGMGFDELAARYVAAEKTLKKKAETQRPWLFNVTGVGGPTEAIKLRIDWLESDDNVTKALLRVPAHGKEYREAQLQVELLKQWEPPSPLKGQTVFIIDPAHPSASSVHGGFKRVFLPFASTNGRIEVKLVDADGLESDWVAALVRPRRADRLFEALNTGIELEYFDRSGTGPQVSTQCLLDIDPALLPNDDEQVEILHGSITVWSFHRAVQWLGGADAPVCYVISCEDMPADSETRQWEPGLFALIKEHIGESRFELSAPVKIFPLPASVDQTWTDYVEMLETHPKTKAYIEAIKEAEKRSPDLSALKKQEAAEPWPINAIPPAVGAPCRNEPK